MSGQDAGRGGDEQLKKKLEPLERAKLSYKEFLLKTEEEGPLWYRVSDSTLTAYGTLCFVTSVVDPPVALKYHFDTLEDIVNVSFFVKFVLLFWSNDFRLDWFVTGKALLDLASCLPVLSIPVRFLNDSGLEAIVNLTQIARFLRLLREALPARDENGKQTERQLPVEQQISAVLLSLLGTVSISATVLFLYERGEGNVPSGRSFEDAILYMVSVFAGRDPPWSPERPLGKLVSAAATCLTIVFIPFLVSRFVELFMGRGGVQMAGGMFLGGDDGNSVSAPVASPPVSSAPAEAAGDSASTLPTSPVSVMATAAADAEYWAAVVRRVDELELRTLLSAEEAKAIRLRCVQRDPSVKIYDICYGGTDPDVHLYASRLRELLDEMPVAGADLANLPERRAEVLDFGLGAADVMESSISPELKK